MARSTAKPRGNKMAGFKEAFRAARKSGKKVFTWDGKSYNTKLKEDSKLPSKAPKPTSNPAKAKSGASRSTSGKDEKAKVKKVTDEARREVARSGATQGFGVGERKRQADFEKRNRKASDGKKSPLSKAVDWFKKDMAANAEKRKKDPKRYAIK